MYSVTHFEEIGSTNEYLMSLAKSGERGKVCVAARSQTAGRGRRGRSFSSPKNGLYMSLLVSKLPMDSAMLLTPMTACAVARAIENVTGISVGIKWVNDLYLEGKKLAGILTEAKFDFGRHMLDYAVRGIGINLTPPDMGFDEEIRDIATALLDECDESLRLTLCNEILKQVEEYLPRLDSPSLIEEYKARSVILGREISVHAAEGVYKAKAVDIDSRGNLIVEKDGKRLTLSSGEISVRV